MNKKNIAKAIEAKVKEWIATIQNETLRDKLLDKVVVTGGCITSMLLNEEINDFDIYFKDKQTTKEVANYYVGYYNKINKRRFRNKPNAFVFDGDTKISSFNSYLQQALTFVAPERIKIFIPSEGIGVVEFSDEMAEIIDNEPSGSFPRVNSSTKYYPKFLSANAITLTDDVQLVVRFYGTPDEIHDSYDFVHCTNYWTAETGVVLKPKAIESILTKELKYTGSKYPLCSVFRIRKFIQRGWFINAGEILKMLFQVSRMDLTDLQTLEDQLVGVDMVLFMDFLNELKLAAKDPDFELNDSCIISLIEKVFDGQ